MCKLLHFDQSIHPALYILSLVQLLVFISLHTNFNIARMLFFPQPKFDNTPLKSLVSTEVCSIIPTLIKSSSGTLEINSVSVDLCSFVKCFLFQCFSMIYKPC